MDKEKTRSGKNNSFYGKKHTKESKEKMRLAHIGKKLSKKTKQKISIGNKGKILSEETKQKIGIKSSISLLGKTHSDATNKKKVVTRKNNGKPWHSEETKKKIGMSNSCKAQNISKQDFMSFITPELERIRASTEYKQWRNDVFEKDDYTCQITKQRGGDLVAHHINNFRDDIKNRFNINNGIVMTKNIHILFHKLYGYYNNNMNQVKKLKKYYEKDMGKTYKICSWNELTNLIKNTNPFVYTIIQNGFVNVIDKKEIYVQAIYFKLIPCEILKKDIPTDRLKEMVKKNETNKVVKKPMVKPKTKIISKEHGKYEMEEYS